MRRSVVRRWPPAIGPLPISVVAGILEPKQGEYQPSGGSVWPLTAAQDSSCGSRIVARRRPSSVSQLSWATTPSR